MSMELYVFSDKKLSSIAEWNAILSTEGFEVEIADDPIESLDGHQPTKLRGRDVWLEFNHWDAKRFLAEETYIQPDRQWTCLLALRWSFDVYAAPAAYMAASAYAKATSGVIYDCEEGRFISWKEGGKIARNLDERAPILEAHLRQIESGGK